MLLMRGTILFKTQSEALVLQRKFFPPEFAIRKLGYGWMTADFPCILTGLELSLQILLIVSNIS